MIRMTRRDYSKVLGSLWREDASSVTCFSTRQCTNPHSSLHHKKFCSQAVGKYRTTQTVQTSTLSTIYWIAKETQLRKGFRKVSIKNRFWANIFVSKYFIWPPRLRMRCWVLRGINSTSFGIRESGSLAQTDITGRRNDATFFPIFRPSSFFHTISTIIE